MSSVEIAKAITIRDKCKGAPLGPDSVEHMLEIAKLPSTQQRFPETCQYQQWEAVKHKLAASKGVRDGMDVDILRAYILYKDSLRLLNLAELGRRADNLVWHDGKENEYRAAGQQSGSQRSLGDEYEP